MNSQSEVKSTKMKKTLLALITIILSANIFMGMAAAKTVVPYKIYYYYGQGCPHCANVDKFFADNDLYNKYPIEKKEVYSNAKYAQELTNWFEEENIPLTSRGVPALVFPNKQILVGDTPIIENFETLAEEFKTELMEGGMPDPDMETKVPEGKNETNLTILAVISGAVVDSINPCAFAVLIILLTTILATGNRKKALKTGIAFATSIFISYMAMGLGLYKALTIGNVPHYFMNIVGVLAIVLGLFNLKDYFNYGGFGFVMEVPLKWRPKMKELLTNVTSPSGAFLIGFLISLFLLPCTSGPYIVVLGMLSQRELFAQAFAYLVLYNLIFIAPMILITAAVFKGFDIKKAEKERKKQIEKLHLIAGIILVLMGIALLTGLI